MKYLILPSLVVAQLRSAAAYGAPEGVETTALWGWIKHPSDGRAALVIPDAPADAGVGLSQEEYDALVSAEERAEMVEELPADWTAETEEEVENG